MGKDWSRKPFDSIKMAELRERILDWEKEINRLNQQIEDSDHKWIFRCFQNVSSTQDVAKEFYPDLDANTSALIIAKSQTQGRGRQGRAWDAADEGFYGTYAFKTETDAGDLSGLSLAVGCVLCETLKMYSTEIGLKWPNDVLSKNGDKLCGILIELSPAETGQYVLIGIGINLVGSPLHVVESTSLFDLSGKLVSVAEVAALLTQNLTQAWSEFTKNGFSSFRERWMDDALFFGSKIVVQISDTSLSGTFLGVDDRGSMLLETAGGTIPVSAGHIISID
ncbi:MAG: biotin--[acetyl-CoA-carboxylase] ligase [Bdellovibrionota bacterium]